MALDVKRVDLELEISQDIDQITNRSVLSRAFGDNAAYTALSTARFVSICVILAGLIGIYLGATAIAANYNIKAQHVAVENSEYKRNLTNLNIEEGRLRDINRLDNNTREVARFAYPTQKNSIVVASGEFAPKDAGSSQQSFALTSKRMLSSLLKSPGKE